MKWTKYLKNLKNIHILWPSDSSSGVMSIWVVLVSCGVRGKSPNNKQNETSKAVWSHFLSPFGLAQATGRMGSDSGFLASQRPLRASMLPDLIVNDYIPLFALQSHNIPKCDVHVGNRLSKTVEVFVLLWCSLYHSHTLSRVSSLQNLPAKPCSYFWTVFFNVIIVLFLSQSPQSSCLYKCHIVFELDNLPSPLQSPNAIFSFTVQMIVSPNQLFPFACLSWTRAPVF